MSRTHSLAALILLTALWTPAMAQSADQPVDALSEVGIDQKLGNRIPVDLHFTDEEGKSLALGSFFETKRPVLLALVYYECPMLCNEILHGVLRAVRTMEFRPGREFEIVAVSINPAETPGQALRSKHALLDSLNRPGSEEGWHFLTGDKDSIDKLASSVGFRYVFDPKTDLFNHAAAIMLVTPEARLSQYFYGVEYSARDLRLALVEAATDKIGTFRDQVLLYCFQYDPATGKYSLLIMRVLRILGVFTVLILVGLILLLQRSSRRRGAARHSAPETGSPLS